MCRRNSGDGPRVIRADFDMTSTAKLPMTHWAENVIEFSMEEARKLKHEYVSAEHILLGCYMSRGIQLTEY